MSIRKDVYKLLCLYDWQERRLGFKPARFLPDDLPPLRPEGKLAFRSEVPDHLLPAYDIALGDGLVEQHLLNPENQMSFYRSMGWPVGMPEVLQNKPWPVFPDWSDALVVVTNEGWAAIAKHRTKSETLSTRLRVDIACQKVTLDGKSFDVSSPQALRWLKVLADRPSEWISSDNLKEYEPELLGVRTDRLKKHFPPEILSLIDSETGKGSRLRLYSPSKALERP